MRGGDNIVGRVSGGKGRVGWVCCCASWRMRTFVYARVCVCCVGERRMGQYGDVALLLLASAHPLTQYQPLSFPSSPAFSLFPSPPSPPNNPNRPLSYHPLFFSLFTTRSRASFPCLHLSDQHCVPMDMENGKTNTTSPTHPNTHTHHDEKME